MVQRNRQRTGRPRGAAQLTETSAQRSVPAPPHNLAASALQPTDRTIDRTDGLQHQLAANLPAIAAVLIDLALRGSTPAIALAIRLHQEFETSRWALIHELDHTIRAALDSAAAAVPSDDPDAAAPPDLIENFDRLLDRHQLDPQSPGRAPLDAIDTVGILQALLLSQLDRLHPEPGSHPERPTPTATGAKNRRTDPAPDRDDDQE